MSIFLNLGTYFDKLSSILDKWTNECQNPPDPKHECLKNCQKYSKKSHLKRLSLKITISTIILRNLANEDKRSFRCTVFIQKNATVKNQFLTFQQRRSKTILVYEEWSIWTTLKTVRRLPNAIKFHFSER